jgi:hypothetical protein
MIRSFGVISEYYTILSREYDAHSKIKAFIRYLISIPKTENIPTGTNMSSWRPGGKVISASAKSDGRLLQGSLSVAAGSPSSST